MILCGYVLVKFFWCLILKKHPNKTEQWTCFSQPVTARYNQCCSCRVACHSNGWVSEGSVIGLEKCGNTKKQAMNYDYFLYDLHLLGRTWIESLFSNLHFSHPLSTDKTWAMHVRFKPWHLCKRTFSDQAACLRQLVAHWFTDYIPTCSNAQSVVLIISLHGRLSGAGISPQAGNTIASQ